MTSSTQHGSPFAQPTCRLLAALVLVVPLMAGSLAPASAVAAQDKREKKEKKDPREMQAREAFAAGSYQDALEIYTKLYAEKLHPTYLRNIGRCYQNLQQPERAISSFREYLRKAKDVPAEERAEVEGYIKEMEQLQTKNAAAAQAAKPEPKPLPPAAPPVVASPAPQPVVSLQQPAPLPATSTEPSPFYKRAWFWGVVGGVVAAGVVGGLWAGGVFSPKSHNVCHFPDTCQ